MNVITKKVLRPSQPGAVHRFTFPGPPVLDDAGSPEEWVFTSLFLLALHFVLRYEKDGECFTARLHYSDNTIR